MEAIIYKSFEWSENILCWVYGIQICGGELKAKASKTYILIVTFFEAVWA